ncbi:metallophosphoesterase family protein [Natronoglycomyces albus]|uniref:Metallophosphoesterase n=1 Tax=Natronoglycomyces albus TaxID=2811108 RepID=A0A895XTD7_9ACTN|nr:metallophosphoesterase [Natronoglycomyces albus]QSB06555.1 metallophosphoesterase [Natronoglycomyces albus]
MATSFEDKPQRSLRSSRLRGFRRKSYRRLLATRRWRGWRPVGLAVALVTVSLVAVVLGLVLGAQTKAEVGPFETAMSVQPTNSGHTLIELPPLGNVILDSHDGPLQLQLRLESVHADTAQHMVDDPNYLVLMSNSIADDVAASLVRVAVSALASTTLAGLIIGSLVFRTMRRTAICGGMSFVLTLAAIGAAGLTVRTESISEPRYEGLLTHAPTVIGSAQTIADDYEQYALQLGQFVGNISEFYAIATDPQVFPADEDTIRVLHVSDLHLNPAAWDFVESLSNQFSVDLVADTGDTTDWGSPREASLYAEGVDQIDVPYVWVKGNHDSAHTVSAMSSYDHVIVLDGDVVEVEGLTIAGVADPRFTPDKTDQPSSEYAERMLLDSGERLKQAIQNHGGADVAMVHDPFMAQPVVGEVPIVLSGHKHRRVIEYMGMGTIGMTEGSTGAAGLRALDLSSPMKMQASVLYFDVETGALKAYDNISVGAIGESDISLQRNVIPEGDRISKDDLDDWSEPDVAPEHVREPEEEDY